MGFVFEVEYVSSKGFLHVTRGVEGFYFQGGVVRKVRIPIVLLEVVDVFEANGAFG